MTRARIDRAAPPARRLTPLQRVLRWSVLLPVCGIAAAAGAQWWSPGEQRDLPARIEYANALGRLGIINADGPVPHDHPFFEPLGTNGRACVSCHQPSDAMSLSVDSIRARWRETGGTDPIFAPVDGANCPHLPAGDAASDGGAYPTYRRAAIGPGLQFQCDNRVLPERYVGGGFQFYAPSLRELVAVILRPWAPHRRALAPVQHAELHRADVTDDA